MLFILLAINFNNRKRPLFPRTVGVIAGYVTGHYKSWICFNFLPPTTASFLFPLLLHCHHLDALSTFKWIRGRDVFTVMPNLVLMPYSRNTGCNSSLLSLEWSMWPRQTWSRSQTAYLRVQQTLSDIIIYFESRLRPPDEYKSIFTFSFSSILISTNSTNQVCSGFIKGF